MKTKTKQLLKLGAHLGHTTSRWNPSMAPHIYGASQGFHIIDVIQTQACLTQAKQFLANAVNQDWIVLFVGTNIQIPTILPQIIGPSGAFYINQRWLGGLLTNWKTLQQSVYTLRLMKFVQSRNQIERLPKKRRATFMRDYARLSKYLDGVSEMRVTPDVVVIINQQEEQNTIRECMRMNLRTLTLLDTDSNKAMADLFIPISDDSTHSVPMLLSELANAIKLGYHWKKN